MADNKKYYYLKLKDNFFEYDEMIILESMPDGYLYSNILLKLYLRSLKYDGRLMFNDRIPFNSQMLATITRHNVGVIEKAMSIFKELNLVEIMESGAIYLLDIQNFIGESSTEADRVRNYRTKIANETKQIPYKCTKYVRQTSDKRTPELEIELEIEKELELEKEFISPKGENGTLTDDQCTALNTVNPMPPKAKNTKPKKNNYAEFVAMTNDEYRSLIANERLGNEAAVKRCIEILDNYKGSSGKKYASDYRAILSWVITKYEEESIKHATNAAKNTKASGADTLVQMIKDGVFDE